MRSTTFAQNSRGTPLKKVSWLHIHLHKRDGLRLTKLTYHRQSTELILQLLCIHCALDSVLREGKNLEQWISVRLAEKIPRGDKCPRLHSHVPPTQSLRHKGSELLIWSITVVALLDNNCYYNSRRRQARRLQTLLFSSNENRFM